MTQRTRRAIINFWFWRCAQDTHRSRRFFFMAAIFCFLISSSAFAEETVLVSKESKPVLNKATQAVKAIGKAIAQKTTMTKKGPELPAVSLEDEKAEGTVKYLSGTVSARNNFGIAVVFGSDPVKGELEMWSEYNKATKLSGYKNFSSIEAGDKVSIQYKQIKATGKKILREVSLVEKKPKEEPMPAEDAPAAAKPASALPTVKL